MAMIQTLGLPVGPYMAPGLEIGQVSQPSNLPVGAAAAGVDQAGGELGATGTPIFGGFLRELGEYNAELTWPAAYLAYEQMRRSDAAVAAMLWASKLPIRGGEWAIQPPEDATPIEQEAAEFIKEELIESIGLDSMLQNALLQFDFGVALHEDVWKIDGNHVRLDKLAPRLPLTFYRWICDPGTDNLRVIEQLGYRAGQYVRTQLPIEKCALFTFRQEGANFTGRSLLREVYQHWYIKSGLYKVDAIACERNGMGVPVVTMGTNPTREDRESALAWVQALVTHQKTGLVLPNGWTFALEGVKGTLRDPKDSIAHPNSMITIAGLAQFMMMGQSSKGTGNRSLGETMSDFFFMGLQATADQIGDVVSDTTVKRLVDFNFPGVERYPRLVPQQIMALKFDAITEALAALGSANLVTEDPDLEDWLRKKMGAPEKPEGWRATAPPPQQEDKNSPPRRRDAEEGNEDPEEQVAASDTAAPEVKTKRAAGSVGPEKFRTAEKSLALSEIVGALDQGRDDVAAALRAARPRIQAEVIHKLVDAQVRNMHRVSIAPDEKLIAAITDVLEGLRAFGQAQVGKERERQLAGRGTATAATVRAELADRSSDPIGLYADGVAGEFVNGLQARATNLAIDAQRRGAGSKGDLITKIGQDLDEQSDKWIDGVASKGANEAFAEGRSDGFEQYRDEIDSYYQSALLDLNTCENCAAADGAEAANEEDLPGAPNPDCDGGDKCRCVVVAVFKDEVKGAA
jgi:phage gp29-like protein